MKIHKLFADDIVIYILASLPNNNFNTIDIHELFYELKQLHPICFKSLNFNTSSCTPYCELIERILMRGYISGILQYDNSFTNKQSSINHIMKKLSPYQIAQLQKIINSANQIYQPN